MTYRAYYVCDHCGLEQDALSDAEPPPDWAWDVATGADFCPDCVAEHSLEQLLTDAMRDADIRPIVTIPDPLNLFTPPPQEAPCPSPASAR